MKLIAVFISVSLTLLTLGVGQKFAKGDETQRGAGPANEESVPPGLDGRGVGTQGSKRPPCTLYSCGRDLPPTSGRQRNDSPPISKP